MNRILYTLFIVFTLSACKDIVDIPEVINDAPVFQSNILINGVPMLIEAGKDNYHNHPTHHLSGDTLTMVSVFKDLNCDQNCLNSLTFTFLADNQWRPDRPFEEIISQGNKPLSWSAVQDSQVVRVLRTSEGRVDMSYFEYAGRRHLTDVNNDPVSIAIPRNDIVEICLTDHSSTLGTSTQCQFFLEKREQPPRVKLKVKDANEIRLIAEPIQPFDSGKAQFSWNTLTTGREIIVTKDRLLSNEVCVKVHYPDQRESQSCIRVQNNVKDFDLVSSFEAVRFEEIQPNDPQLFGFVDVSYVNDSGKQFTCSTFRQNSNSFFEITGVEEFYDEVAEIALKRLAIRFELELFASDGESISVKSSATTIAILPPQ